MSMHYWSVDGYGICADDIRGYSKERLMSLIYMAPEFEKEYRDWMSDLRVPYDELTVEQLLEYEDEFGNTGLAAIMRLVIEECTGIPLTATCDSFGYYYLIIEPSYPWRKQTPAETNLQSIEIMDEVFKRFISALTDETIRIDYQSAENFG